MRILAIDPGEARTGLALADDTTRIATPLDLIEIPANQQGGAALIDALARAARDHAPGAADAILMGDPINMDGSAGPRATRTRALARMLADALARPITLVDERRSSVHADERMARSGLTRKQKKSRRDAIAAAAIADAFLDDPASVTGVVDPDRPAGPGEQSQQPGR